MFHGGFIWELYKTKLQFFFLIYQFSILNSYYSFLYHSKFSLSFLVPRAAWVCVGLPVEQLHGVQHSADRERIQCRKLFSNIYNIIYFDYWQFWTNDVFNGAYIDVNKKHTPSKTCSERFGWILIWPEYPDPKSGLLLRVRSWSVFLGCQIKIKNPKPDLLDRNYCLKADIRGKT